MKQIACGEKNHTKHVPILRFAKKTSQKKPAMAGFYLRENLRVAGGRERPQLF